MANENQPLKIEVTDEMVERAMGYTVECVFDEFVPENTVRHYVKQILDKALNGCRSAD